MKLPAGIAIESGASSDEDTSASGTDRIGASLAGAIDTSSSRTVCAVPSDAAISSWIMPLKLAGGSPLSSRVCASYVSHAGSAEPSLPRISTSSASPSTSLTKPAGKTTLKCRSSIPLSTGTAEMTGASLTAATLILTRVVAVRPVESSIS